MKNKLIKVVNNYCLRRLGELPNLEHPRGYNEKINWLKIYDQMYEHVICCNKLLSRAYVLDRIHGCRLLRIYQVARYIDDFDYEILPERYMLKANHDSGTVYAVTDKKSLAGAKKRTRKRLRRTYGIESGEWAYSHIVPYVFVEEYMDGPIIDYKFHCCVGDIRWVQIISDRASGNPRETIVDQDYVTLPLHMDHKMIHDAYAPEKPESWEAMKAISRTLSRPFRYVRVDLYQYEYQAVFGELTFWPMGGSYKTKDEPNFGNLLNLDTSFKRPMIHNVIGEDEHTRRGKLENTIRGLVHRVQRLRGARFR